MLAEGMQQEKQISVSQIVALKTERFGGHIQEISYWDELVTFIAKPSTTWAEENIIEGIQTAGGELIAVFDTQGKLVYRWQAPERGRTEAPDLRSDLAPLGKKRLLHWFEATPAGLWELHGATIHHSNDPEHKGPYSGYIISARLWDQQNLKSLGKLTNSELQFLPIGERLSRRADTITTSILLSDASGEKIGTLEGFSSNPVEATLEYSLAQAILFFFVFGGGCLIVVLFLLRRWIDLPILRLAEAMRTRSAAPLQPLRKDRSELGELARLVQDFFHQEDILRSAHDELEVRVAERTEELEHRAFHDTLTGLPNRAMLRERLEQATALARSGGRQVAVLFIDLDNFKVINDSLGHEAGDVLLCNVAQRMLDCMRPADLVTRLGGDEFAVLIEGVESPQDIVPIVQRLTSALVQPLRMGERMLCTSVSIGVALSDGHDSGADLLRDADTAMYHAKAEGKARHAFFDSKMKREADERLELEADLRQALLRRGEELYLVFQPIVALDGTHRIIEIEALLRWKHPVHGVIAPGRFIPLAEEIGLIHELTAWVLEEACSQMSRWTRLYPQKPPLRMSVNISARTLQEPDLSDWVLECLKRANLAPHQLILEITESVLMRHTEAITASLQRLRKRGVQVAIDDFGTGYSSMSSLAQLPVDIIKIDQSFVARLEQSGETQAILQAMVELARAMQLAVVSEGIETSGQRESLQRLGSHYGQGYLFSHPLLAADFEALLTRQLTPLGRAA